MASRFKELTAVVAVALLAASFQARAGFALSSWPTLPSFSKLSATLDSSADEVELPISSLPFSAVSDLTLAVPGYAAVHIDASIALAPLVLETNLTRLDRSGRTSARASGAWVFTVTEASRVVAFGNLNIDVSGANTENELSAELYDLTSDTVVFRSIQRDHDSTSLYELGGLDGNRSASFEGSLDNVLDPSHVYRLSYGVGAYLTSAAGSSEATGLVRLAIVPIPEPSSLALVGAAMFGLAAARKRGVQSSLTVA